MGFEGYKFKHKLIVMQSESANGCSDSSVEYAQNFEITMHIYSLHGEFVRFDQIETVIRKTLDVYSFKPLDQIYPFTEIESTLENLGTVLYQMLNRALQENNAKLEMLEISESPLRTFIVNDSNSDKKILFNNKRISLSTLLMGNIISQSTANMISGLEEEEEPLIPIEPAPVPEEEGTVEEEEPEPLPQVCVPVACVESAPLTLQKKASALQLFVALLFLIACGLFAANYLRSSGTYPSGSDTFGHLFKADLLYNGMKSGDWYPLYTNLWYNGMQPFRYWAPGPYYLLATLEFVMKGDAVAAYYLFVFVSFAIGGMGWLLWGWTYNRLGLCTFMAIIWFFLPDNLRVFFSEGNLPRMVIAMLLPYLFFFVWRFVDAHKKWAIIPIIVTMCLITICHTMIAAMIGITSFIFLSIYSLMQKRLVESLQVIGAMLLSFAVCGIWLFPALQGGLMGMDASATAEVMRALSFPVTISLNPTLRSHGGFETYYFGISVFVLSVAGLFLADKKSHPGFYTVLAIFGGTTTALVTFLEKLPLNQLLWMMRFTPIVYAVFLLSLLQWKSAKKYALIVMAVILIADCLPAVDLKNYHSQAPVTIGNSLKEAEAVATQRVSLLDVSAFGSYPSYGLATEEPKTPYTFGWAWQGASTSHNIVMVNTALEKGYYYYLFDRCLELGDDTVLVHKDQLVKAKKTLRELTSAAEASGYKLYQETNYTYIFHKETPKTFGLETEYLGLAIGTSANTISLEYPVFEEGNSENLGDYTFDEMSRYKIIYLSGFTYNVREDAEALLTKVANAGTRIIIDMNRIPVDALTSRMTFFDVTAQSISFTEQYPELIYNNKIFEALPFKEEYSTWNTVYLENLDRITGYSWFKNKRLAFLGTAGNKNILFLGYNILFHALETDDEEIMALMSDLLEFEPNQLPKRDPVALKIEYRENRMIIDSPGGELNTTIAYQDNFRSEQKIVNRNNLLYIEDAHTEIKMIYPYLIQGIIVSIFGLIGSILLVYFICHERGVKIGKKLRKENSNPASAINHGGSDAGLC